ncbi:type VI secretion system baseplate subunit TssG [Pararhodobacter sp. SW119]|uniref:type VI secretion system baseplate subunit TssG n=1 Tax=Pararhodobacter sp. SW119 TaxID=2780075 RepID=UPI001ADFCBE3|nr:type VI secretion system baseplate subunit TssG [Pararhodobacter sp. SW119]
MEARRRHGADDLTLYARLVQDPRSHHLFQAMRILEAHHADRPRLGRSRRPEQDALRLGQEPELAFARTTIVDFARDRQSGRLRLAQLAFGYFGPNGPLPLHLTEFARERKRKHRDSAFVAFADMLTHRLLSLFYRAWTTGQPAPSFDRPDADPYARKVAALAGLDGKALRDRDAMPDLAKLHFAGHLSSGAKPAEALVAMISAFFDAPVRLQQFVGSWLELEPDDRWQLGQPAGLGRTTSIGNRVYTRSAKFRIRLGPVGLEEFKRLLPGNGSLERLASIVRNHVGDALDWDVNLVLKAEDVPRSALGGTTALGHTSWLGTRRSDARDADDLYLAPPHVLRRQRASAQGPAPAAAPVKETPR